MRWLEMTVTTSPESSEAVAEKLRRLGADGVSIEEPWDWEEAGRQGLGDIFPAKENMSEMVILRGYLPLSFLASKKESELKAFLKSLPGFGLAAGDVTCREVEETDWENSWKEYWQPTEVGNKLLIVPSWLKPPATDRNVMFLDPGPAFGTGTHETTRLCLELMECELSGQEVVLDLGSGSGILALYARMLGAQPVFGIDRDKVAVSFGKKNALINNLDNVTFLSADLTERENESKLPAADLILANLTSDLLIELIPHLPSLLLPRGRVIASGIINERTDEVRGKFSRFFNIQEQKNAGVWAALLLEMKQV